MRKTNRSFVVLWSFENFDFISIIYQKRWRYNTNNKQILNSKCEFVANLFLQSKLLFVCFGKLNFSDFWGPQNLLGPSKKTQLLDSWSLGMP